MTRLDPTRNAFRLVLAITFACDLRCPYCYVRPDSKDVMSLEDAACAVDLALARLTPGGRLHLGFFGGEPLLELERMLAIADDARRRAREHQVNLSLCLTTNGTLLTDRAIAELSGREFEVTVSFDGVAASHDAKRPFRDGRPSHDRVTDGIRRALTAGLPVRVNMVADPTTVARLADGVSEAVTLGVNQIEVSPNYETDWDEPSLRALAGQYEAIGELYAGWTRSGRPVVVSFIESKLAAAIRGGTPVEGRCSFGVREIAVDPRRRIYPCERLIRDEDADEMVIGRLPEGVDQKRLDRILAPRRQAVAACGDCGLEGLCVNWCACVNYRRTGSIAKPDGLVCFVEDLAARVARRVVHRAIGPVPARAGGGLS